MTEELWVTSQAPKPKYMTSLEIARKFAGSNETLTQVRERVQAKAAAAAQQLAEAKKLKQNRRTKSQKPRKSAEEDSLLSCMTNTDDVDQDFWGDFAGTIHLEKDDQQSSASQQQPRLRKWWTSSFGDELFCMVSQQKTA